MAQSLVHNSQLRSSSKLVDEQLSRLYTKLSISPSQSSQQLQSLHQSSDERTLPAAAAAAVDDSSIHSYANSGVTSAGAMVAGSSDASTTPPEKREAIIGHSPGEVQWGSVLQLTSSLNYSFGLTEEQLKADEAQKVFYNLGQLRL